MDDASTLDEIERAHQRYNDRETIYLTELGLPRWKEMKTKKNRRFIEDDDEIPDLADDGDSDDEDNDTAKQLHWRVTHNEAARATASTNSSATSQSQATSSQANSESSKRTREKSMNYQPDDKLLRHPDPHSANTLHTEDTQKPSKLQNPIAKPSATSDRTQLSI